MRTPRLEDTPLMLCFEMADELRARGGKDVIFRIPGIPSPMDIVAQMVNSPKAALPEGAHVILSENAATREQALQIAERLHREYR